MAQRFPTMPGDDDLDVALDVDPVCGTNVEIDGALERGESLEYEGHDYVFCGPDCRSRFEHSPHEYAAAGRSEP